MTTNILKSTTAIVLSLSLATPTVTMAQSKAELAAEFDVDTSTLSKAEIKELRQRYKEIHGASAEAAEEGESLLDRAVGAVSESVENVAEGVENLTGANDAEAEATAEAEEQSAPEATAGADVQSPAADATAEATTNEAEDTGNADAAPEATAETADPAVTEQPADTAEATNPAPESDATAETTAEAETQGGTQAEADTTADAAQDTPAAETSSGAQAEADTDAPAADSDNPLQAQVDELQKKLDALTNESAEEKATRQAATEAAAAEAQAGSMAASADADSEAAEVVEQTVTEDTARSSSEEFETTANAESGAAAPANTANTRNEGLDTVGKIALFGLGALAVGQLLKNGSEVVSNSGDRVVVQQPDGSYKVYKNDDVLMFQPGTDVKTYAYDDGSTRTVATREDGTQIETIRAADGTVLRRTRILADGTKVVLFDDTQVAETVEVNQLPQVSEADRSVNIRQAQEDELRAALAASLPQQVDRRFSLSQVRNINAVRGLVPEIDVDNITFETGSSTIRPDEAEELAQLGTLMRQRIEENPGEVFLIEGHTDAVGSASYNLALSDRRAESVALALSEYFDVPPENMVVQGYGESDLKIRTAAAERENRRAAVRRITPLLTGS